MIIVLIIIMILSDIPVRCFWISQTDRYVATMLLPSTRSFLFLPLSPRVAGLLRLWGAPFVLNLLVVSGLATALLYGFAGAVWSWVALGVPVLVMGWHGVLRKKQ